MTPVERKLLKTQAHKLDPVVIIGGKGLTDAVLKEIDLALKAHELIKVRAPVMDRDERDEALSAICARLGAQAVQQVGKVFVLFRSRPPDE
jgi:RNA-binding protein